MKVLPMASSNLAELLFNEKERLPYFGFYLHKTSTGDYEWACEIKVEKYADSYLVIGNYCGGGAPFCFDVTSDSDSSGLCNSLDVYLNTLECDKELEENVVFVDEAGFDKPIVPEAVIVLEDGFLSEVYSNLKVLNIELIDNDVTELGAMEDNYKALEEIKRDVDAGRYFSHW